MIEFFLGLLIGYAIGNISPSYIIARIKGFDIRKRGTGNAGASNVAMTVGKPAALFTAVFDILKAAAATLIVWKLFPIYSCFKILGGIGCIIGHIFPILMGFKGGKGLACLGGLLLAYDPMLFLMLLALEGVIAFYLDYICIIPMTGSVLFLIIYTIKTGDPYGTMLLSIISLIIVIKHRQNMLRIRCGTEPHISILWSKDKEKERISKNSRR